MNKAICIILSALFWGGMAALSLSARAVHNGRLPHTEVLTVKKQDFICTFSDESGNILSASRRAVGIPKALTDNEIYVIIQEEVYGETRNYACYTEIMMYDDYYSEEYNAVMYGLSAGDKLIVSSDRPLSKEIPVEVYYDGQ